MAESGPFCMERDCVYVEAAGVPDSGRMTFRVWPATGVVLLETYSNGVHMRVRLSPAEAAGLADALLEVAGKAGGEGS